MGGHFNFDGDKLKTNIQMSFQKVFLNSQLQEQSRDPTDPCASEVTTEPIDPNRCLRPLQRARERREARLKKESDAHAEFDPDPHVPGSQRSSVSSAREQDRVHLRCNRCNNKLTDADWSKIKSKGWDAEIVEHAPFCSSCIDQWRVL